MGEMRNALSYKILDGFWLDSLKESDYLVGGVDGRVILIRILEIYEVKLLN